MNADVLLDATGLVKRFGGVTAIDRVSLRLERGRTLGVIGPNGAGKSTLVGLIGGAIKASDGRVVLAGEDITRLPASERARRGVGRTYQIPRPFLDMTVRENLLAARFSLHPFAHDKAARSACDAILERCGLADAADWHCRDLPLLRRKRLEVARALALDPQLLLLDEVGAGLIDAEVSELIALIQSLRAQVAGIVIIEHVLRVVRECCDELLVINFGKPLAQGTTREVLASEEVAAVYLGTQHQRLSGSTSESPAAAPVAEKLSARLVDLVHQTSAQTRAILELHGVHAGYGQARVLNGIDLTVRQGQVVAILGVNGAGKTTLAKVVSGVVAPSAGSLRIEGNDVTGFAPHRLSRLAVAQCMEGRRIFPSLSVEQNLLLPARGISSNDRRQRLALAYELFPDLKERRHLAGTSMSGGQQQMLAIARALMARPKLVVFDEISLGLAPIMMDRLYLALAELRKAGLTMLIVEQDVERALDLADEVHVMEHGCFALSGTAAQVRADDRLRQLYIGTAS